MTKQYLTVKDVCRALQVCRMTVYRLVKRGELRPARLRSASSAVPGSKPRGPLRFDPEEVERFVRRCRK